MSWRKAHDTAAQRSLPRTLERAHKDPNDKKRHAEHGQNEQPMHWTEATHKSIRVAGERGVRIMVAWSGDTPELTIGPHVLKLDPQRTLEPAVLEVSEGNAAPPRTKLFPDIGSSVAVERNDQVFLRTVADLDASALSADPWEVLRSSKALRILFIDERPLVHDVRRRYQKKLEFLVFDSSVPFPIPPSELVGRWRAVDPGSFPAAAVVALNLDQFLATEEAVNRGDDQTRSGIGERPLIGVPLA